MRVISKGTLKEFWSHPNQADSEGPLKAWYAEVVKADWKNPGDVKHQYASASVLKDSRLVFNIAGNKYRLVVKVHYQARIVFIRFIGTHKQYDEIDPEVI
jgi:mRNA interferase HigB